MRNDKYRPRLIDKKIDEYLKAFGAVCVEGAKWCGKTWTSAFHAESQILIGNPENNFQNRKLAEMSPELILGGETPRLIDEWQEVPPIWDAVRYEVDKHAEKGQFILTGSATPNHKGIMHSGAGRIAKIRMRPMSLYESGDSSGKISLKSIADGTMQAEMTGEVELMELFRLIVRGGWPGNISILPTFFPFAYKIQDRKPICTAGPYLLQKTNRNSRSSTEYPKYHSYGQNRQYLQN